MNAILLSIKPEYAISILNGNKIYEYRKKRCKKNIDKIIIYATHPIKKVLGEVDVLEILEMKKEKLWLKTKNVSGITKEFFEEYYKNTDIAVAYKLGAVKLYKPPKTLYEIGVKVAPQSYIYL